MNDDGAMRLAIEQARTGLAEGGVPVGAALVADGSVLGVGRNRRVQWGSVIRHGETDCLENAGRLAPPVYRRSTLYTTLSPCHLCAGAVLLYRIPRVVIGEHRTFEATENLLAGNGVDVRVLDDAECAGLMREFIDRFPGVWDEDIAAGDG
ncbi:nucleoside deaminase [Haloechinothrix alba]|nr:nucleoside deaminase [Haloechinothrix alba]